MRILGFLFIASSLFFNVACQEAAIVMDDAARSDAEDVLKPNQELGQDTTIESGPEQTPSKPSSVTLVPSNPTVSLPEDLPDTYKVADMVQVNQAYQPPMQELENQGLAANATVSAHKDNSVDYRPNPVQNASATYANSDEDDD